MSVSETVEKIHTALSGKKKEEVILDVIMSNNYNKRIEISQNYKQQYEISLFEDINSKIGGDFGKCAAQTFLSPLEFCIYHLKIGIEKSNACAMEQLTSKSIEELKIIEEAYKTETQKDLKSEIEKKFSGAVGKNILNLFDTPRVTNHKPNKQECEKYAKILVEAEPKNWTEDENIFKEIFIQRSPEELIMIARYYLKLTGNNLIDIIESKTKGLNQTLLKEILYNNILPHELFADKIYNAIKGLGTDEEVLSRALVARCELDMSSMRDIYYEKYKVTMKEDIIGDTSENYQKLCIYLSEK
jgi:hypothetical protein